MIKSNKKGHHIMFQSTNILKIPPGDNDLRSGESERRSPKDPLLMLLSPALYKRLSFDS